jgi:hypothetical protein
MARTICIKPCASLSTLTALTVPLMGGSLEANPPGLAITNDCPGCNFSISLLAQLNTYLSSLGIPLCALGCLAAVITAVQAVPDSLGPPPDPGKLVSAIANVVTKCECVFQFALPPPIGAICAFLILVAEILELIAAIVSCLVSLVMSLTSLNIKASILMSSDNPAVVAAGQCMAGNIQGYMDLLGNQLGGLKTLWAVLQPILSLLDIVPGLSTVIGPFMSVFQALICGLGAGTSVSIALTDLLVFQTAVQDVADAVVDIAAACPPSSPPVC